MLEWKKSKNRCIEEGLKKFLLYQNPSHNVAQLSVKRDSLALISFMVESENIISTWFSQLCRMLPKRSTYVLSHSEY